MVAPATGSTEKGTFAPPEQAELAPVIDPGADGAALIVIAALLAELVPQLFVAVTEILPPVDPIVTVIAFVPDPLVIVAPVGTVQL